MTRAIGDPVVIDKSYRAPALLSLALHGSLMLLAGWSWQQAVVDDLPAPRHLQAVVVGDEILQQRAAEQQATLAAEQARIAAEKAEATAKARRIAEEKQQAEAKKQQQLAAERQAEAKRLAEQKRREARQIAEQKKIAEEKQKAEAQRQAEEKRQAEEQRRVEEERRAAEARQAEKQQAAKQEEARQTKLAEQARQAEQQREQRRLEREQALAAAAAQAAPIAEEGAPQSELAGDAEQIAHYKGLIRQKVSRQWKTPPGARKDMQVKLKIRLLPTGELRSAAIIESSGNGAFDRSALQAVERVRRFPVPENNRLFEQYFRSFSMVFEPQDFQ